MTGSRVCIPKLMSDAYLGDWKQRTGVAGDHIGRFRQPRRAVTHPEDVSIVLLPLGH